MDADEIEFVCSGESSKLLFVVSQNTALDNDTVGAQNGGVPPNLGYERPWSWKVVNEYIDGKITARVRADGWRVQEWNRRLVESVPSLIKRRERTCQKKEAKSKNNKH